MACLAVLLLWPLCGTSSSVTSSAFAVPRRPPPPRVFDRSRDDYYAGRRRDDWSCARPESLTPPLCVRGGGGTAATTCRAGTAAEEQASSALLDSAAKDAVAEAGEDKTTTSGGGGSSNDSVHLRLGSEAMLDSLKDIHDDVVEAVKDDDGDSDEKVNDDQEDKKRERRKRCATLLTYQDRPRGVHLCGLDVSKPKFRAFVKYELRGGDSDGDDDATSVTDAAPTFDEDRISEEELRIDEPESRERLREVWRKSQLLTDRTEVLASYRSDKETTASEGEEASCRGDDDGENDSKVADTKGNRRRGDFPDLLSVYADRLMGILRDERDERNDLTAATAAARQQAVEETLARNATEAAAREKELLLAGSSFSFGVEGTVGAGGLLGWLEAEYGHDRVERLRAEKLLALPEAEQVQELKLFLEWFREKFPYYYDKCDHCGASERDGTAGPRPGDDDEDENEQDDDDNEQAAANFSNSLNVECYDETDEQDEDAEEDDDDATSFLGYVHPTPLELAGRASRTELYRCRKCHSFTRFPRYNAAASVVAYNRGRCGEYSMLLFRFLRVLGVEARWVVDWSDHVWAEAKLGGGGGRWVHLDPCEAAVDEPLLYQGWGKTQTFIVAFAAPPCSPPLPPSPQPQRPSPETAGEGSEHHYTGLGATREGAETTVPTARVGPMIEDVTQHYTSDTEADIATRRDEPEDLVLASLLEVEDELRGRLNEEFAELRQSTEMPMAATPAVTPVTTAGS